MQKYEMFTKVIMPDVLQGTFRGFASNVIKNVFGEEFREKSKGRNHDISVAEYKVAREAEDGC